MKKEILLIRHGESVTNSTEKFQAGDQFTIDPLNDVGEAQGRLLAQKFKAFNYVPDIIVNTGYLRGLQTAQLVEKVTRVPIVVPVYDQSGRITDVPAKENTSMQRKSLFRELDLPSELEGMDYKDPVAIAIKDEINQHLFEPDWHYSDEENLYDIWKRARVAREYLEQRTESKIAVFTHGGFMKALLANILHDDDEDPEWTLENNIHAYRKFHKGWAHNTGIISAFYEPEKGSWQPLLTSQDHIGGAFGFMNNEPSGESDTSADALRSEGQ